MITSNEFPEKIEKPALTKTSISTFTAYIISFLLSIIITILIARILGPTGKGIWSALVLIPAFTYSLFNLGIEDSNVYFSGSGKYETSQIINNSFNLSLWILLVIFLIYLFTFDKIFHFLSVRYPKLTPKHLFLVLFAIPFVFVFNYLYGILQGKEKIYTANILSVISQILTISGILVVLLVFRLGLLGLAFVYFGVRAINTVIILLVMGKGEKLKPKLSVNRVLLRDSLSYGFRSYLASGLEMLNFRADVFLIYAFLGPRFLGFYTVAVAVSEIVWYVSKSVAFPLFPRISSQGREDSKTLVIKTTRIIFWISLLFSVLLSTVAFWLIPILFGGNFTPSIRIVYFLLPGILFYSPAVAISTYYKGTGRPEVNTFINSVTLLINIGLNLLLIIRLGIIGAAIASVVSYTMTYVIYLLLYSAETETSPLKFFLFNINDFRKL